MLKVKMLVRHTGPNGKMESGLEYLLSRSYAQELVNHGLAVFVIPGVTNPLVNIILKPNKIMTMEIALREMRVKNQGIIVNPKGKRD